MIQDKPTTCAKCGAAVPVRRGRANKFCSPACLAKAAGERSLGNKHRAGMRPANSFAAGHAAWNKGVKGLHLSPATEFRPGPRLDMREPIGAVKVRRHRKERRAWVKIADPNVWRLRAVVVWEAANGPLPKGLLVHHKDRDMLNDEIGNLQAMTRAEHIDEHRDDLLKAKLAKKSS